MNEELNSSERSAEYTRQQVIETFKKFPERGATDPADLDLQDPEVIEANKIHDAWVAQEEKKAQVAGTEEARLLKELEITPVFVDAGFDDQDYLEDVANDWLSQTLWDSEEVGLTEVAAKIQAKINEINAKLEQQGP